MIAHRESTRIALGGMLLALGLLLPVLAAPAAGNDAGYAWHIEMVHDNVGVGGATGIVLDPEGDPHLAYADADAGLVRYVRWTGTSWESLAAPQSGYAYGPVSLALDARNRPHIAFFDAQTGRVKYAFLEDVSWRVLTVDSTLYEGYLSLAIDPEGNPHIAYPWVNGHLRHAQLQGSTWTTETVDPDSIIARYPSLAIDRLGHPNIAYYAKGNLYRAVWIGYRWDIETVENGSDPQFVTLRFDSNGTPKIGYRNPDGRELRYISWDGSAWIREIVDATGDTGWDARLALDGSGNPHFSYYERTEGVFKYAHKVAGTWILSVVDISRVTGWWSDLAIGSDGRPRFSYYSWGDHSIRYAEGRFGLGIRLWPVRDIGPTTANLRAELTSLGSAPSALVAIEWRVAGGEWGRRTETTVNAPGIVATTATGLTPSTTYEARALAIVDGTVTLANTQNFTTPLALPPGWAPSTQPIVILAALSAIVAAVAAYVVLGRLRKGKE